MNEAMPSFATRKDTFDWIVDRLTRNSKRNNPFLTGSRRVSFGRIFGLLCQRSSCTVGIYFYGIVSLIGAPFERPLIRHQSLKIDPKATRGMAIAVSCSIGCIDENSI